MEARSSWSCCVNGDCTGVTGAIYGGPLSSAALLLLIPSRAKVVDHSIPASYEPKHKGGVDTSSGLYTREDEDLIVRDSVPLVLTRTYLSGYHVSTQFGVGGTHPGEWYLIGDGARFQWSWRWASESSGG